MKDVGLRQVDTANNPGLRGGRSLALIGGVLILVTLALTLQYNYLLFHSLAEVFSIVIGCGIFMMAWNTRGFLRSGYFILIGVAYLWVSALDFLHTLAYEGMGVFDWGGRDLPTQLWIAARFLQASSLLIAPFFVRRRLRAEWTFVVYAVGTTFLILAITTWRIFPACYVQNEGLTTFKRVSEYAMCLMLGSAIALLLRERLAFDAKVLTFLIWSLALTIVSELAFTLYFEVDEFTNMMGHYFKIIAFYLIYKAIIETGLKKPYALFLRESKQNEERYRLLFERNPDGVFALDVSGQINAANPACAGLTGFTVPELMGTNMFDLCVPEQKEHTMAQFQRALRDRLYAEWETTLACPNGTRVEVWVAGEPILHEGQAVAVYCTVKDITGRKQSEAALRQAKDELARANESLEQRVQERTAALRETVDELERYTYSIAHDMRQPLRSMRMFSQWLQEEHTSGLSSEGCDYLRRIEQAAARMDSLVVDVLSYSQVSRMELRREDVDLTSLVRQIVHEYFDSAGQESIEVVAPLTPVHANMALLTQILANLLGNALKFVAPGVKPRVLVYTERREGRVRLTVEDNGIGIAEADRARIWEIFGKVHHRDQYEGTGIGLSIVRKAVERMGGVVGVDSEPGKGTRFWFELPPSETAG